MIITSGAYCRPESRQSLMVGWAHNARGFEPSFDYSDQDTIENSFSLMKGWNLGAYEAWEAICEVLPPSKNFRVSKPQQAATMVQRPITIHSSAMTNRPNLLHLLDSVTAQCLDHFQQLVCNLAKPDTTLMKSRFSTHRFP